MMVSTPFVFKTLQTQYPSHSVLMKTLRKTGGKGLQQPTPHLLEGVLGGPEADAFAIVGP